MPDFRLFLTGDNSLSDTPNSRDFEAKSVSDTPNSALERDCDKKLWISCHDLSKYGKPHTNADTAPLGGRPVSALPTPPPPPCDYTGYDPPKKHTNRRWKSLKGTWAACGTRSPQ